MTEKKISTSLDPSSDAKQASRREWDEVEDEVDTITERDIQIANANKYTYSNSGSGFSKATDHGKAGRNE